MPERFCRLNSCLYQEDFSAEATNAMLYCEYCKMWWHQSCVGTSAALWSKIFAHGYGDYACPTCVYWLLGRFLDDRSAAGTCVCNKVCTDASAGVACAHCGTREHLKCLKLEKQFPRQPRHVRELVHLCGKCSTTAYNLIEEYQKKNGERPPAQPDCMEDE